MEGISRVRLLKTWEKQKYPPHPDKFPTILAFGGSLCSKELKRKVCKKRRKRRGSPFWTPNQFELPHMNRAFQHSPNDKAPRSEHPVPIKRVEGGPTSPWGWAGQVLSIVEAL